MADMRVASGSRESTVWPDQAKSAARFRAFGETAQTPLQLVKILHAGFFRIEQFVVGAFPLGMISLRIARNARDDSQGPPRPMQSRECSRRVSRD
jgi:hypothetical protein